MFDPEAEGAYDVLRSDASDDLAIYIPGALYWLFDDGCSQRFVLIGGVGPDDNLDEAFWRVDTRDVGRYYTVVVTKYLLE